MLPTLATEIRNRITEYEEQLIKMGKEYDNHTTAMIEIIEDFTGVYIDRTFSGRSIEFNIKERKMSPAAEISIIFHEEYVKELNKVHPLEGYDLASIVDLLRSKTVCF